MITISLCMIVKDEEEHLRKCLDSVKDIVDEIVIVDTGSTDHTKDVARKYTDKVYDFKWINDFSAARNESFSHATMDYIMWLDADDILLEEDRKKLLTLKLVLSEKIDIVYMNYNYAFDEDGKLLLSFKRERLVKREKNFKWIGFIHEVIECDGISINADICVTHTRKDGDPSRNLRIYKIHVDQGEVLSPRDQYYYGKELFIHRQYEEALKVFVKFLENPSWSEDIIDAVDRIGDILIMQGKTKEAREYLFKAFDQAVPRAETLFRIGFSYEIENKYEIAAYWHKLITQLKKPVTPGFVFDEYWTWRPYLELCVCYDHLGEKELAYECNEKAAAYVPDLHAVKQNREYFKTVLNK